ncbi:DUF6705 family protein [Bacteroides sp. 224]|uniref:DUF6705 family protein n=1 Tax=Bacteroides sp. 224 TaxID=2302936 RepID=UPI0013D28E86|nr:DUF6705 family protein [Bacteroides sp. 224]NDV64579.1 hypothetical protein [Bacteroides sp. 224]
MKRFFYLILLSFITTCAFSQRDLTHFEGVWKAEINDTIFRIKLKQVTITQGGKNENTILGGYSLSVKGVLVQDYIKEIPDSWDLSLWSSEINGYIWGIDTGEDNLAVKFYDQKKKHFNGNGITGGIIQPFYWNDTLFWLLDEEAGILWETEGDYLGPTIKPIGFSVPSCAIMTREEEEEEE